MIGEFWAGVLLALVAEALLVALWLAGGMLFRRESGHCEICETLGYKWWGYGSPSTRGRKGFAVQGWIWRHWHATLRERKLGHRILWEKKWADSAHQIYYKVYRGRLGLTYDEQRVYRDRKDTEG